MSKILRVAAAALVCTAASVVYAQDAREGFATLGCGVCHGEEGRGGVLGPNIATRELTTAAFIDYVRSPTGTMPAYNTQIISDQLLTEMHEYLEPLSISGESSGHAEQGAVLYRRTGCYQCHANEGQGGAQGPRVGPDPLTLARFTWYVRNPSGGMPPYTHGVMSDQDLADIHAFLEARPQPPSVESNPLLAP